jgi:prevent-host-death family protein
MKAIISLEEFRKNLSDIVSRVMYGDQTVLVQKHSKPGVIVMKPGLVAWTREPQSRFAAGNEEAWRTMGRDDLDRPSRPPFHHRNEGCRGAVPSKSINCARKPVHPGAEMRERRDRRAPSTKRKTAKRSSLST